MDVLRMMKRPSAFLPLGLSFAALATVLGHVALFGAAREADEGAAAHIFQLLMAAQVPILVYFAIQWLPRNPRQAVCILALQAGAAIAALAPFSFSTSRPTGGGPSRGRLERVRSRHSGLWRGSHLAEHARAAAEAIRLDAHLVQHADEEVGQRLVVLAVEGDVTGVAEAAAGEQDRQVVAGVRRGVPQVAAVEHHRLIEQRSSRLRWSPSSCRGDRRRASSRPLRSAASCLILDSSWPWCVAS